MQERKVIVFVGMPGSGKSVCVEYLKEKGLATAYFGGITLEEIKRRGLPVNEANEKAVREDIRAQEGNGAYAQRIIHQIEQFFADGDTHVVVDGLYSWTEYKIFKEKFGDNAMVVAVVAPRSLRHERLAKRTVRPLNEEEAGSRDYAEIENIEKGGPIANADYFLSNVESVEALTASLHNLLHQLSINLM
jgi:dephospho-CoA kinase